MPELRACSAAEASRALRASLSALPRVLPVVWYATKTSPEGDAVAYATLGDLADDLRAVVSRTAPKGRVAFMGAGLVEGARTRQHEDLAGASLIEFDHDGPAGSVTLGAAVEAFRALGLAGVFYPSPSEASENPLDAVRWHGHAPLADGTTPDDLKVYGLAAWRGLGALLNTTGLDRGVTHAGALAFVPPRHAPRGPDGVVCVGGLALNLSTLATAGELAGWFTRREAQRDAKRARMFPPSIASRWVDALERLGLIRGPARASGKAPLRCPRGHEHSTPADTRGDTSTVVDVNTGYPHCSHTHGGKPLTGWAMVRALIEAHPELAPYAARAETLALVEEVRETLALAPPGETARRVVHPPGVADDVAGAGAEALRRRALVLLTPTVGAGKSRGAAGLAARITVEMARLTHGERYATVSAGMLVDQRERLPDVVGDVLRELHARRREGAHVRVNTPPHQVVAADGARVCIYPERAEQLYQLGASARGSLCDRANRSGGRCENYDGCAARDAWVPWQFVEQNGQTWPVSTPGDAPTGPWVALATHANAGAMAEALRREALLVADESNEAFRPRSATLDREALAGARAWAGALRGVRLRGSSEANGTPRVVASALANAACTAGVPGLLAIAPGARRAFAVGAVVNVLAVSPPRLADAEAYAGADGCTVDVVAGAALARWADGAGAWSVLRQDNEKLPQGGGAVLEGLARWAVDGGAQMARLDESPDDAPEALLTWPSPSARAAFDVVARDGGVLALDATGDAALHRGAVPGVDVVHDPVRVPDSADVVRVMVATKNGGRRALTPGARTSRTVLWGNAGPLLAAGLAALRRAGAVGAGAVFAPLPLRAACEVLALAPDATTARARELLSGLALGKLSAEARDAIAVAVGACPPEARETVRQLGALGVTWAHYGGRLSRGSNELRAVGWIATVGDPRPALTASRLLGVVTGRSGRAQGDRAAAEALAQCHGRARVVQPSRTGERVVLVHVGVVPPLDWHGPDGPAVDVVSVAEVMAWRPSAGAVAREPVADLELSQLGERQVHPNAHPDVRAAVAAGWGVREIAAAVGVDPMAVSRWITDGRVPRGGPVLARLRQLGDLDGEATLRARLLGMERGRGVHGIVNELSKLCRAEGVAAPRAKALGDFMHLKRALPREVLTGLVRVMGAAERVIPGASERTERLQDSGLRALVYTSTERPIEPLRSSAQSVDIGPQAPGITEERGAEKGRASDAPPGPSRPGRPPLVRALPPAPLVPPAQASGSAPKPPD